MKLRKIFKRTISVILVLCLTVLEPFCTFAEALTVETTVINGTRFTEEQLIEGDLVYFGAVTLNIYEGNNIYEVPVFREGDLSKEASVTLHSLDISALYKEDYAVLGGNKKEFKSEMSILEMTTRGIIAGDPEIVSYEFDEYGNLLGEPKKEPLGPVIATPSDATATPSVATPVLTATPSDYEDGSLISAASDNSFDGKSKLAVLKEKATGEPTREAVASGLSQSLTEGLLEEFLPAAYSNIPHSSEQVITFAPGEDVKYVRFRIYDDNKSEGTETFTIVITDCVNVEAYVATSLSVLITDNEETVHSKLSFDSKSYTIRNGRAKVTVKRTEAEHTMATADISGTDILTGKTYTYGTVVFAPYENEKEAEIYIDTETELSLTNLTAADEGEVMSAFASPMMLLMKASMTKAGASVLADNSDEMTLSIKVDGTDLEVKYKKGDISAPIFDKSYSPALEVGTYFFSTSTAKGGIFSYDKGQRTGSKPWGCGTLENKYEIADNETDFAKGYGDLKYYHTTITKKGTSYTYNSLASDKLKINGLYYRYLVPHWEETSNFGGDNYAGFSLAEATSDTSLGTKFRLGAFPKELSSASAIAVKNVSDNLKITVSAVDKTNYTPKSYVKFYGVAAMYKKFRVSVNNPEKMTFKGSTAQVPMQVQLKCGANLLYSGDNNKRDIFANLDENASNLVFTVKENKINGTTGVFGQITGYNISITPSVKEKTVKKTYPADYIKFLNDNIGKSTAAIDYSADTVNTIINRVNAHIDTIPVDKYFIAWIESVQLETISDARESGNPSYYQELTFTPLVDYVNVKVTVVAPDKSQNGNAKFNDANLKEGKVVNYHAGDRLDMSATPTDSTSYRVTGYELSTDGGAHFNAIRDSKYLTLEPYKNYIVRPLVAKNDNHIEVIFLSDKAKKNLQIENLIPASELSSVEYLEGRNVINVNPKATTTLEKMKPSVGNAYTIRVLVTGKPANPNNVYRPVIKDRMTGRTYNGQGYSFIQRSNTGDNVIEVDIEEVPVSSLKDYSINGHAYAGISAIRGDGTGLHLNPITGYTVSMENGEKDTGAGGRHVSSRSSLVGEDGTYSISGLKLKEGDRISLLIDNGYNDAQVAEIIVTGGTKDSVSGVTSVTADRIEIEYPANAPRVVTINYDYDKSENRQKVDLKDNSIRCFDDNLTLSAVVDLKGRTISKLIYTVTTVTGATSEYTAKVDENDPTLFTATINGMLTRLHNGDRISVRIVDSEKRIINLTDSSSSAEIVYPTVETGLVTYVENEKIAPKEFKFDESAGNIDIPVIGAAKANAESGLLTLSRTDWPNNTGYSLSANMKMVFKGGESLSADDRRQKTKTYIDTAKATNNLRKQAKQAGLDAEDYGYSADQIREAASKGRQLTQEEQDNLNEYTARKAQAEQLERQYGAQAKADAAKQASDLTADSKSFSVKAIFNLDFEFIFDPVENEYILAYGAVTVGGAVEGSKCKYFVAVYVPCFFNISGSVEVDLSLGLLGGKAKNAVTEGNFNNYSGNVKEMLSGKDVLVDFNAVGKLKFQIGAGLCDILSARGYIQANLKVQAGQNDMQDERYGIILGISGGIGIDLVLVSFNMDIVSVNWGWGRFEGRTKIGFFNNTLPLDGDVPVKSDYMLSQASSFADAYQMNTEDEISVSEYEMGESPLSGFGGFGSLEDFEGISTYSLDGATPFRMDAHPVPVKTDVLLPNAADRTRPEIIELPDGRLFAVFVAASGTAGSDSSTLYYAVCDTSGNWGTPAPVETDGTYDSMPDLALLDDGAGNYRVFITWMDAYKQIDNTTYAISDNFLERFNTFEISGAVYDVATDTIGAPFTVSSAADKAFYNQAPRLAAAGDTVYCTYITSDLSGITDVKELVDPKAGYKTMNRAIMKIDGTALDSRKNEYVVIRHDTIIDPVVTDYQTSIVEIGSSRYLVTAYTIDEDDDFGTGDRNIYLGIRDITDPDTANHKEYYPIRLSDDDRCQAVPKLNVIANEVINDDSSVTMKDTLYLSWIEDGEYVELLDVTAMLESLFHNSVVGDSYKGDFINGSNLNKTWYIKNASQLGISDENYEGSYYKHIAEGEFRNAEGHITKDESQESSFDDYALVGDGKDLYLFYTDFGPEIDSATVELYARRFERNHEPAYEDGQADKMVTVESGFTDAVRITDLNMVIDDFDLVMKSDDSIFLLTDIYNQYIEEDGKIAFTQNKLVSVEFGLEGSLDIDGISIDFDDHMVAGNTSSLSFDVTNWGLMEAEGFSVRAIYTANGSSSELYNSQTDGDRYAGVILDTNESINVTIPWTVPEGDLNKATITLFVKEYSVSGAKENSEKVKLYSRENISLKTDGAYIEDNKVIITGTVRNTGNADAEDFIVNVYEKSSDKLGRLMASANIGSLASGEAKEYSVSFAPLFEDWNDYGSIEMKLRAERNGEMLDEEYESIYSTKPVDLLIETGTGEVPAPGEMQIVRLDVGETETLSAKGAPWNGLIKELKYTSTNGSVAAASDDGTITAVGKGVCYIDAYSPAFGIEDSVMVIVTDNGGYVVPDDDPDEDDPYAEYREVPSWVENGGNWILNEDGTWKYDLGGAAVVNRWLCVLNPYADPEKKQRSYGWFKFDEKGIMLTGWYTDTDGNIYYLNPLPDNTLGMMLTGWQLIDGRWYYFSEKAGSGTMGALYRNTYTPDGYLVDGSGAWVMSAQRRVS
ncbi:MAG: Calx-beta domain-containing protein [Eubacteriales bacterium]|nr:Calx-beta domain-containing protein [Eubacteriales bacterium]